MKPYEVIEHTADVGLRIYGQNQQELFVHGALGLFDLITDIDKIKIEDASALSFDLEEENLGDLFLSWLRELLFTFSTRQIVFKEFVFQELTDRRLKALGYGKVFDPKQDEQKCEVKAVTYYQFKLEKQKEGWVAEVIFDI